MKKAYEKAKKQIMESLEEIALVKGTPSSDYLEALEEIHEEVDSWFEASIDAARDDVKRSES